MRLKALEIQPDVTEYEDFDLIQYSNDECVTPSVEEEKDGDTATKSFRVQSTDSVRLRRK